MHTPTHWPVLTPSAIAKTRLTWDDWCAFQHRVQQVERRRQDGIPFNDRELAHLTFIRWLHQMGRLVP